MPNFSFLSDAAADLVNDDAFRNYGSLGSNNKRGDPASNGTVAKLGDLKAGDLFDARVVDASMAECCLSGLWLLHNFLDRSHSYSQGIATPEGSYWHGIMHRMEGDFGNSKYWFRQVGQHPVFETLNQQTPGGWDYDSFVDQCDAAADSGDSEATATCRSIAVAEWKALFAFCGTQAVGPR